MKSAGHPKLRMLALDLDETLLRSDLTISPRTRAAIKCAWEAGAIIVLVSGRILSSVEHFSRILHLHERPAYLVCNYGALIQESNTGNIVHEALIDRQTILAVCDLADAEGFPLQMYDGTVMYVSRQNKYASLEQELTGIRQVVVENFRAMVGEGCYKLIIPGDPEILAHVETIVRTYLGEKVNLSTSRTYYLELMPRGTDKHSALAKIAEILKVSADETMAIGDSINDETMIRWAGIGVAMANGNERVKNIADLVTEHTNNDDGAAEVIEKYFLGKEKPSKERPQ